MKKICTITAVLLLLATASIAMAGPGRMMGFDRNDHLSPCVLEALKLTQEQNEKIRALHETYTKEITPIQAQLVTKRAEIKLLWKQTTLDAAKIKAVQNEIQGLFTQIRDKRTDMRIAFRSLLTPEQTNTLLAMGHRKGYKDCRGDGYGSGKGRGQGFGKGQKSLK